MKVFLRLGDVMVRFERCDPGVVLEAANKLHTNLQFTIEELDTYGILAFLDLSFLLDSRKQVTWRWS